MSQLSECPLCFARLLPLSVCHSCSRVEVCERLDEVGPDVECEDCGASNPTHFVCSACNARFPFQEIVRTAGPRCPKCKSPVPPRAEACSNCSTLLPIVGAAKGRLKRRVRGEYAEEDILEVARIPNLGKQRAETLCKAGYNRLWKIQRATEEEIAKIPGFGPENASNVRESLRFLLVIGRPKTKDDLMSEECECPRCRTVTSLFATKCHDCGVAFDGEEIDPELLKEAETDEEPGLLEYYNDHLLRDPNDRALLYARAFLLLESRNPSEALAAIDAILQVAPGHPRALQAARALGVAKGLGAAAPGVLPATGPPAADKASSPTGTGGAAADRVRAKVGWGEHVRAPAGDSQGAEIADEEAAEKEATEALASLTAVSESIECPDCGEVQPHDTVVCSACGRRLAPDDKLGVGSQRAATPEEEQLLDELHRAIDGDDRSPVPPLAPEVPPEVIAGKRSMLVFLARIPGVSKRAADAVCGFFQDITQIGYADVEQIAALPGVAPAEARLVKAAVVRFLAPGQKPGGLPRDEPGRTLPPVELKVAPLGSMPKRSEAAERRPTGFEGRRGLVNGQGLVNGRGRVNGLVNGTGFVNGVAIAELRLPRNSLMPRYIAIGASLLMLFSVAAYLVQPGVPQRIVIDGRFGDWQGVPEYVGGTTSANPNVQIRTTSVHVEPNAIFLRIGVVSPEIFSNPTDWETVYAFLDVDGDNTTGYDLGDLGADYAVRVSGSGSQVEDARLLRFDAGVHARDDWAGFVGSVVLPAATGVPGEVRSALEVSVPTDALEGYSEARVRVRFAADDNAGETSQTLVPVGSASGALLIEQAPEATTLGSGPQLFLTLTFRALGNVALRVEQVLLVTKGGGVFTPDPIPPVEVAAGSSAVRVVSVDAVGLPSGTLVTAVVTDVQTFPPRPFRVVGPPARAYVSQPPPGKVIDGLFADWPAPPGDTDSSPIPRRSLNLVSRDGNVSGDRLSFYAKLDGEALEGGLTPYKPMRTPPGGPAGGPLPAPGGTPPPLVGLDYLRFFVDTDARTVGGFDVGGVSADRMFEVRGRAGRVTDAGVYRFVGANWSREVALDWGLGVDEIEVGVLLAGTTFNLTRFVAISADWSGVADRADPTATRGAADGGTRSTPEPPVVLDVSGNGPFWFRDTDHATETACTTNKVASSTKGSGAVKTITLNTGGSACWYVDATTGQTIPTGTWETLLDVSNTGGADYHVRIQIWNLDANTVAETITECLDQTDFTDDARCFLDSVAQKTLTSTQVVRLVFAHGAASGTVSIDYDDSDSTGDSRATLPIPEFPAFAVPVLAVVFLLVVGVRRPRRASAR